MTKRRSHRGIAGLPARIATGLLSLLLLTAILPRDVAAERHAVATSGVTAAGVTSNRIKVGTRLVKPFVMEENGALTGFSIELWRELMTIANRQSDFNLHGPLAELLAGVQSGPDDAAIAAISITAQREKVMDFSVPIFKSGLGIMVPDTGQGGVMSTLRAFINADMFTYAFVFLIIMAIPAHIIWWAERKYTGENDIPISAAYYPGILQAMYWAIATTGGQAEGYPRSWLSRIVSLVCIYASIISCLSG